MSANPETFESVVEPLREEFGGLGCLLEMEHRQFWPHVFFQLGYSKEEVIEMMTTEGGEYEI
ncbi:hypothetical protein H7097_00350 [Aeromicrobium sp.]|nr:hypothetical protein [Candidatus Saccharibacteria bacterium]